MLVTFKTNTFSDITLFGDPAVSLLKMMGQSGNVPGAVMAEDVAAALASLKGSLASAETAEQDNAGAAELSSAAPQDDDPDAQPPVALHKRAGPLIQLLEAAVAAGDNVMWNK